MANLEAGTSSDAALALGGEYQVFLNFRGPDTRHGFTDFLYDGLLDVGVRVFRDDDELRVGEGISENLLSAINNSKIYIPIFSRTFASSKWCLWELAHIVDNVSKSESEKCILPIFLNVEPDDVKLKTPLYNNALSEHERKFPGKVEAWRAALAAVGKIKGWNVTSSQSAVVRLVVGVVLEKLKMKQKSVTKHLIGLDDRVKDLMEFLDVHLDDVRLIGIYGMGGIGKTTIAKIVFNQICSHFGRCCSFLEGVRERSTKEGIVSLQKKLLSDIGGSKFIEKINDDEDGTRMIGAIFSNKKVLLVMDDVDKKEHIMELIGNSKLHPGSRIIITTRNTGVLQVEGFIGEIRPYEMLKMEDDLALQLFYQHAFNIDFPGDIFRKLSSEIVSRMGGLPLAIEVVGSLLKGKDEEFWEETLISLRNVPEKEIMNKLKISYDGLDKNHKQIFLDIACFFFNEKKTNAIYMWTSCELQPKRGIEVLTERCLIKILGNDQFWMHDQLIDLGRQIVREESQDDLGKQSRLWIAKEALQIIGTEEVKRKVQALEISSDGSPIEITNENFERLPNVRFLDLKGGTYIGDFAKCHSKLRWFSWSTPFEKDFGRHNLDWQFRASNLYLDQLVVCKLYKIDFKDDSKAWDMIKRASNLKVLSIIWCSGITTIPDISKCLALERLNLYGCSCLKRIEGFIGYLQSLIELEIEGCSKFTDLPVEIGALVKLKNLSLSNCEELRELPGSIENLTSLTKLDLSDTKVRELPNSIGKLQLLQILCLPMSPFKGVWYHDWQLPSDIGTLVHLKVLDLSGHLRMKGEIPIGIGECSSLRILNLKCTRIFGIPRTINKLHQLQFLNLTDCHKIQELPELPTSLTNLHLQSRSLLSVPNLSKLTNLVNLLLSDGSNHEGKSKLIPGCDLRWIGNLSRLKRLELRLLNVPAPPNLTYLSQLQEIVLRYLDLKPLVQLPSSNWNWRNLSILQINCCEVEEILLDGLSQLEDLQVFKCEQLQQLSIPLELRKLGNARVYRCPELVEIRFMGVSKSLKYLTVLDCDSLTRISGLSYLKNLNRLEIGWCNVLTNVEGLNELESPKALLIYDCFSLRWSIDASCAKIPDDCTFRIRWCGYSIKNSDQDGRKYMSWKQYREEILLNASNKISFTIQFHLGGKESSERFKSMFVDGVKKEKEVVDPDSVTYEGLIADVKNFGFRLKRMWCQINREVLLEIKCDEDVKYMVQLAARRGLLLIYLFVKGSVSCPNEDSNSAPVGRESETHGTSSVDDFELEQGNAECSESTSIAEEDLGSVKKQVELHKEPKDEETITLKCHGEEIFLNTSNKIFGF